MIFGQTHEERRRRATQLNEWRLWFAWYPVQLEDGRWAFWQNVLRQEQWYPRPGGMVAWSQGATQSRASQVEGDRQS
jgi:hypothetical protein